MQAEGYGGVERIGLFRGSQLLQGRTNTENRWSVFYCYLSGTIVFQYIQLVLSDHPATNTGGIPAIKERMKIT
jgi:hypothetical protein